MARRIAPLQLSERAWIGTLGVGLWLVLLSGRATTKGALELLSIGLAAALGALLSLWIARATGDRRRGLALALATLLATPLLPYAYAGLALALPLGLFAAAFFAIGPTRLRGTARDLAMLAAGIATLCSEPNGPWLLPLLLWLAWEAAERRNAERRIESKRWGVTVAALFGGVAAARLYALPWTEIDLADSPLAWGIHVHGLLLSLNKGLICFAPLAAIGLWRAFRGSVPDRRIARFALFAAASRIVPLAGLERWADATWASRPLLALIPPAMLALALSRSERARSGGRRRWILAAVVGGLLINTLGTAVPQRALTDLAELAGLPEGRRSAALSFDPAWHHARVNASLLGIWLRAQLPALAPGPSPPAAELAGQSALAIPGPILLRVFDQHAGAGLVPAALWLTLAGALGWGLLVWVRQVARLG